MARQLCLASLCLAFYVEALRTQLQSPNEIVPRSEAMPLPGPERSLGRQMTDLRYDQRKLELVDPGAVAQEEVPHAECRMEGGKGCDFGSLPKGKITRIYPGGETTCISGDPYFFEVYPGDSKKLLLFFDGGGACWTEHLFMMQTCRVSIFHIQPWIGIFDPCAEGTVPNPVRDFTAIRINYCSGDLHLGHVNRNWTGLNKNKTRVKVVHRGYLNTKSAVDWAKRNVAATLSNLALTGSSAGVIGLQFWGMSLLADFKYQKAVILLDSWLHIVPSDFDSFLLNDLQACETPLFQHPQMRGLLEDCRGRRITGKMVFDRLAESNPEVPIAQIQTKYDNTQRYFHDLITTERLSRTLQRACRMEEACESIMIRMQPDTFYERSVEVLRDRSRHPNYAHFLLASSKHAVSFEIFGQCRQQKWTGPTKEELQRWLVDVVDMKKGGKLPESVCEDASFKGLRECPSSSGRSFDPDRSSSPRPSSSPAAASVLVLALALGKVG